MEARGTPDAIIERDRCSEILFEEHTRYIMKMRGELSDLPNSSKKLWKLANSLQGKTRSSESVQALKATDGSWARTPEAKAELLSETFARKSVLPVGESNEFSVLAPGAAPAIDVFLPVRKRQVRRELLKLNDAKATGPDQVSAKVLKRCADSLALPLALVIRLMLSEGRWPSCWRFHHVVPLFKKKARSDPCNYKGVHLTSQISKVVERLVGKLFLPQLQLANGFGERQFAYSIGKGLRDALALSVLSWLLGLERGCLIGLYCSDVSGAFDRVCELRLRAKLCRAGIHPRICSLLQSWLEPRRSAVVVKGASSAPKPLQNSVYQGTVWGPPLWNIHFADARLAVTAEGFTEVIFADDMNCSKEFPASTPHPAIMARLEDCQSELHRWGAANRVCFDAGKESFHCLHRTRHFGENFKMLGVTFDCQLTMKAAVQELAREAGWRVRSILRCRRFFNTSELVRLYKAQVLSYIESRTPAIHHAARTTLDAIDRIQKRFLQSIGLTELEALTEYRLAPLSARRDMAMLGLLHRVAHGLAPRPVAALFPWGRSRQGDPPTRGSEIRHTRQLAEFGVLGGHTDILNRSCFGLVTVWNMLPSSVAEAPATKLCQRALQQALVKRAKASPDSEWQLLFSNDARIMPIQQFQRLFSLGH